MERVWRLFRGCLRRYSVSGPACSHLQPHGASSQIPPCPVRSLLAGMERDTLLATPAAPVPGEKIQAGHTALGTACRSPAEFQPCVGMEGCFTKGCFPFPSSFPQEMFCQGISAGDMHPCFAWPLSSCGNSWRTPFPLCLTVPRGLTPHCAPPAFHCLSPGSDAALLTIRLEKCNRGLGPRFLELEAKQ